jgi:hypothetical protein
MTKAKTKLELVFALHPTTRGFGWVLFEGSTSPVEWGTASAKKGRNAKLLAQLERILKRCEPTILVLEAFEGREASRVERIQTLCRDVQHIAAGRGVRIRIFPRSTVQGFFAAVGATTRYEIAMVIAEKCTAFNHRLPPKRKPWMEQDPRQSIFDAAALVLTYYSASASRVS